MPDRPTGECRGCSGKGWHIMHPNDLCTWCGGNGLERDYAAQLRLAGIDTPMTEDAMDIVDRRRDGRHQR